MYFFRIFLMNYEWVFEIYMKQSNVVIILASNNRDSFKEICWQEMDERQFQF